MLSSLYLDPDYKQHIATIERLRQEKRSMTTAEQIVGEKNLLDHVLCLVIVL